MSNLEPEQVKQAESAPSSPENAPESPEKKEESALYYTKWQQRMMKKGYVVTPKVKKPAKQNAMEWIATLVGALLLVLLLKAFVGSPVVVDGNSMYPTLHNGEIMIMSKLHYGTSYLFNQPIVLGGEPERFADVQRLRPVHRAGRTLFPDGRQPQQFQRQPLVARRCCAAEHDSGQGGSRAVASDSVYAG